MLETWTTACEYPLVVSTPTTASVLPIPYAEPPSMILTSVIVPPESKVILAVACLPVVDEPIDTSLAL